MPFAKANPKQARLKVSMYGPPGSGKTFTALLFAEGLAKMRDRRIAYVDTERGTDFYAQSVPTRAIHPEAFDFDALYTRSLAEVTDAVKSLSPATYGIIVIDSVSHLWDAAQDAYTGRRVGKDGDKIPFGGWASLKKPYKHLIDWLMASPFDVFICGRQKTLYEDTEGEVRKVGVGMRAEADTPHEPHICLRMEFLKSGKDCGTYIMHVEKDRAGVLAGRAILNPNFATIEPLLPLLGDVQAEAEDEDERIAKDGELIATADEKAAAKEAKSRDLLGTFQASVLAAQTVEALGAIGAEIKKQKRYMLAEHQDALRLVFTARRDQIVTNLAPEMT